MIGFTAKQLRAFALVARHRSFSRAAAALFITPSGLSILIRQLERQLGAKLFERTTRQVTLTHSGAKLLGVAQRTLQDIEDVVSEVGRSEIHERASLSIGSPPLVALKLLVPAIQEFRAKHPEFCFQICDTTSSTTMQKVESGELDIGLGVFFRYMPGVRRLPLFRFHLCVIGLDEGTSARSISWTALTNKRLIALPASLPLQNLIDKHLARAGVDRPPALVVNYLSTQIGLVEAGEGVAVIPSYWNIDRRDRRLRMSRLVKPSVQLEFCQIRRSGRELPAIADTFTTFLQRHIAERAGKAGSL
jgi:LysR family carnitine catabolism transcriptional activator